MSNSLAIAAVTTTLQTRIARGFGSGVAVTSIVPGKARDSAANNAQINIYLYQIGPNSSLRNMDISPPSSMARTADGQSVFTPPLSLNLFYLVTAYGQGDSETDAHRLLGQAMLNLNDRPILSPDEIRDGFSASGQNPACGSQRARTFWNACISISRSGIDSLAQRVQSSFTWSQLVLPGPIKQQLRHLVRQVKTRSHV